MISVAKLSLNSTQFQFRLILILELIKVYFKTILRLNHDFCNITSRLLQDYFKATLLQPYFKTLSRQLLTDYLKSLSGKSKTTSRLSWNLFKSTSISFQRQLQGWPQGNLALLSLALLDSSLVFYFILLLSCLPHSLIVFPHNVLRHTHKQEIEFYIM